MHNSLKIACLTGAPCRSNQCVKLLKSNFHSCNRGEEKTNFWVNVREKTVLFLNKDWITEENVVKPPHLTVSEAVSNKNNCCIHIVESCEAISNHWGDITVKTMTIGSHRRCWASSSTWRAAQIDGSQTKPPSRPPGDGHSPLEPRRRIDPLEYTWMGESDNN